MNKYFNISIFAYWLQITFTKFLCNISWSKFSFTIYPYFHLEISNNINVVSSIICHHLNVTIMNKVAVYWLFLPSNHFASDTVRYKVAVWILIHLPLLNTVDFKVYFKVNLYIWGLNLIYCRSIFYRRNLHIFFCSNSFSLKH